MWDHIQKAYFERIGAKINPAGIVEIPRRVWAGLQYTDRSIHDKNIRTWMINSVNGCCLIFEHKHFEIV